MGCYNCGKDGGTEVKLCPPCNTEKRAVLKGGVQMLSQDSDESRLARRKQQAGMFAALCGTLAFTLYILLFAPFGPMYGYSAGERAYARCVNKLKGAKSNLAAGSDPMSQQMQKIAESMVDGMAQAGCEVVKRECDKDSNSVICKAALK